MLEIHELKKVIRLFWVNFIKVSVLVISKFLSSFPSNVQRKQAQNMEVVMVDIWWYTMFSRECFPTFLTTVCCWKFGTPKRESSQSPKQHLSRALCYFSGVFWCFGFTWSYGRMWKIWFFKLQRGNICLFLSIQVLVWDGDWALPGIPPSNIQSGRDHHP